MTCGPQTARFKSKRWKFRSPRRYEATDRHVATQGKLRPAVAAAIAMKRLILGSWRWLDDRLGISALIGPSLKHLVPHDARWWYVFGSATMLAFIVQVVTGVALAFSYASSSSQAYETLEFITNQAPFGRFLR